MMRVTSHLKVADEGGRSRRDEASLGQDARLHVAELQTGVVARHLTCGGGGDREDKTATGLRGGGRGGGIPQHKKPRTFTLCLSDFLSRPRRARMMVTSQTQESQCDHHRVLSSYKLNPLIKDRD